MTPFKHPFLKLMLNNYIIELYPEQDQWRSKIILAKDDSGAIVNREVDTLYRTELCEVLTISYRRVAAKLNLITVCEWL